MKKKIRKRSLKKLRRESKWRRLRRKSQSTVILRDRKMRRTRSLWNGYNHVLRRVPKLWI